MASQLHSSGGGPAEVRRPTHAAACRVRRRSARSLLTRSRFRSRRRPWRRAQTTAGTAMLAEIVADAGSITPHGRRGVRPGAGPGRRTRARRHAGRCRSPTRRATESLLGDAAHLPVRGRHERHGAIAGIGDRDGRAVGIHGERTRSHVDPGRTPDALGAFEIEHHEVGLRGCSGLGRCPTACQPTTARHRPGRRRSPRRAEREWPDRDRTRGPVPGSRRRCRHPGYRHPRRS